jgi:predicted transcriptional regulator YdeE
MSATIIKCERITSPPVRFIGKRYDSYPNWNDFWEHNWFDEIEKSGTPADVNDNSYCVLTGAVNGRLEYYLGEFFKEDTPVPEGFDYADIPAFEAALFFIKGKTVECYMLAGDVEALSTEIEHNGMTLMSESRRWLSFERDNCPRWTDPDADGNQILDYGIFLK